MLLPAMNAPALKVHKLTTSVEDYLERIYELIESKGYARVSDIAAELKLSRPSVSLMVQRLSRLGFVEYEKYRGLVLTPRGQEVATRIRERHHTLIDFFACLGVQDEVAVRDVEGIEHHISEEALEKFQKLVEFARKNPVRIKSILAG